MDFPRNDLSDIKAMNNFIGEDFTKTGRFHSNPAIQNIRITDPEESRKNNELMLKFLKDTEYIEETAMDNEDDPCLLCGYGHCHECQILTKTQSPLPKPKKKDRYDLLKEGL